MKEFITCVLFTCRSAGQSVGDCPELGIKLQVFMSTFFSSLPSEHRGTETSDVTCKQSVNLKIKPVISYLPIPTCFSLCFVGHILLQMVQQLGSKHWCAVPLLFLSQALSSLPPSPLLGMEGLTALRCLIMLTVLQSYAWLYIKQVIQTCRVSQGSAALHHDHSSGPAERRCTVLPAAQRPPPHRRGKTQIVPSSTK